MSKKTTKYNYHELKNRPLDQVLPVDVNEDIENACKRFGSERVDRGLKEIRANRWYGCFRIIDASGIVVAECKSYARGVIPNILVVRAPDTLPFLQKDYFFVNMISKKNDKVGMKHECSENQSQQ